MDDLCAKVINLNAYCDDFYTDDIKQEVWLTTNAIVSNQNIITSIMAEGAAAASYFQIWS